MINQTHLILHNGNILTMAEEPLARAVAVNREGRIIAVGAEDDVLNLRQSGTKTLDLRGRTLIPGFFDCHMHILWLGLNLGHVNLFGAHDKETIIERLRDRLAQRPEQTCVQGNNYDQNTLPGAAHLTRHDLDRVATDRPVRIVALSGHAAVVNTRALELLGFRRETEDPVGGEIVRDAQGEPTGVLLETASWSHLDRILPETTAQDAIEALGRANRYLLERGITSATDANTAPEEIAFFAQAVAQNRLQVRTNCMVGWKEIMEQVGDGQVPVPDELQPMHLGAHWHRIHVGQAKLFSDGAITTRTAWLMQPFEGMPDNYGIPLHPPAELKEYIRRAHCAGWQIATHAIGDRAVQLVLEAYAEAQRQHTRYRPGHRIEHCMLLDADHIARLRRQNIWSIGQPEFLLRLGDAYILALGEERAQRLSPYATLEAQQVAQAFSSDDPVVPGAPLDGLRAAMERKTPGGVVLNAAECLAPDVALFNYTLSPAFATRTERDRGSIEAGKWGDFTLLSADPTATPLDSWESVQVEATFVGGECLFGAERWE
jgi:predicted amidohydrolase YtcJ